METMNGKETALVQQMVAHWNQETVTEHGNFKS